MTHNDLRYEFGPYQLDPTKRILTGNSQNVFTFRRALGDDRSGPKYIETVARRGYRFIRSVETIYPQSTDFSDSVDDTTKRPVVVVLPFQNHTGNVDFDY